MHVSIDLAELAPVIAATVAETLAAMEKQRLNMGDRLAFTESEAGRLLSMAPHQVRDERLRGRLGASMIVGRGVRYTRSDLEAYLARHRTEPRI